MKASEAILLAQQYADELDIDNELKVIYDVIKRRACLGEVDAVVSWPWSGKVHEKLKSELLKQGYSVHLQGLFNATISWE